MIGGNGGVDVTNLTTAEEEGAGAPGATDHCFASAQPNPGDMGRGPSTTSSASTSSGTSVSVSASTNGAPEAARLERQHERQYQRE